MPDISMCLGEETSIKDNKIVREGNVCPLREKCYRFKAKPSEMQSYSNFTDSLNRTKTNCKNFMELWKKNKEED